MLRRRHFGNLRFGPASLPNYVRKWAFSIDPAFSRGILSEKAGLSVDAKIKSFASTLPMQVAPYLGTQRNDKHARDRADQASTRDPEHQYQQHEARHAGVLPRRNQPRLHENHTKPVSEQERATELGRSFRQ